MSNMLLWIRLHLFLCFASFCCGFPFSGLIFCYMFDSGCLPSWLWPKGLLSLSLSPIKIYEQRFGDASVRIILDTMSWQISTKKRPFMHVTTFKRKLSAAKKIKETKSWNCYSSVVHHSVWVCVCVCTSLLRYSLVHDWAIWAIPMILTLFNFQNAIIFISMAIQLKIFHTKQI